MRDAGDACLAHGGERRGERGVVWSRVIRPRNAGESESAFLRGAAGVGGRGLARPKLWASAAGASRLHPSPRRCWWGGGHAADCPSPRAPPHVGRRGSPRPLRFSRAWGQAGACLPREAGAAVRVAQRSRRRRPDGAVPAGSVPATEPRLGCCERALPPASPFGDRVTPGRAVPPAPAHVQCLPSPASDRYRATRVSASAPPPRPLRCCSP